MGRVRDFVSENKLMDSSAFPKLKLKVNEKSRIVVIEAPYSEYIHEFRAPKIINGEPAMKKVTRQDGSSFEDYEMDFLGNPICLGDEGILDDKGQDPTNCPACEAAANGDSVGAPKRRFASNVVEYNTKPGSSEIIEPFGVTIKVWGYTERVYNKLIDLSSEFGDLKKHDLLLGPCESPEIFQKFDISPSSKAEWLSSEENKKLTLETYKNNKCTDLAPFCGRKSDRARMTQDINTIKMRWSMVNKTVSVPPVEVDSASLAEGLEGLLEMSTPSTSAVVPDPPSGPDIMADLANDSGPTTEPEVTVPKPGSSGEALSMDSLDDLLAGLD